MMLYCKQDIN